MGYSGHVPGKGQVDFTAPLGGVPTFQSPETKLGQGVGGRQSRDVAWFGSNMWEANPITIDKGGFATIGEGERPFREEANGVMVSYAGHVPRSRNVMGAMTKGGVPPFATPDQPLGQTTRFEGAVKRESKVMQEAAGTRKEIARKAVLKSQSKSQSWITKFDPYTTTTQVRWPGL